MARVCSDTKRQLGAILHGNRDLGGFALYNRRLISLILPAYNEAGRIRSTVEQALAYFDDRRLRCEIVVPADGDDGTREIVRELGLRRPGVTAIGGVQRRGKGRGIREAVALAQGEIIGFADADNKVPIQDYAKIETALADGIDVVVGSRGLADSRIERSQPFYRQLGGQAFGLWLRAVTGLTLRDTQCGFKFFPAAVARDLFTRQQIDGYMFDAEILYIAHKLGYSIREVPVRWRDDGDSRLNLISGNVKNFKDVLRIRSMHLDLNEKGRAENSRVEVASR